MKDVLFLGDDSLLGAASYLGGVLTYKNIPFDYVPSNKVLSSGILDKGYRLVILSDYPAANISGEVAKQLTSQVKAGGGLLMIGGWESFHGLNGEYNNTLIEEALPVTCMTSDDRVNYCQGLIPVKAGEHTITKGLPFGDKPPVICGYNRVFPREHSDTILNLRKLKFENDSINIDDENIPLLVIGKYGSGKVAAFTTDFAPHWVGGLVDWGEKRIKAQAPEGEEIEVGNCYADFIGSLVGWFW